MAFRKPKTFSDCYLYTLSNSNGYNANKEIFKFLMEAQRVDISSTSFSNIVNELKSRAQTSLVVKALNQPDTVLCIAEKELPASFKVMCAKDPKSVKHSKKTFIDCTGLLELKNGFFTCKEIDKLAAYLIGSIAHKIYNSDYMKFTANGNLQKLSISSFVKMFTSVLDGFRFPGYDDNRIKIRYIIGVYFAYNVMRLEIDSAKGAATAALNLNRNDTRSYDFYYTYEDDFTNIKTFIESLAKVFKLKGLEPSTFIATWLKLFGKGTMYALEFYPTFLTTLIYAYSGCYINNVKRIEAVLDKDLINIYNAFSTIANTVFSSGFKYESALDRNVYKRKVEAFREAQAKAEELTNKNDQPGCPFTVTADFFDKYKEKHGLAKDDLEIQKLVDDINHDIAVGKAEVSPVMTTQPVKEDAKLPKPGNPSGVDPDTKEDPECITQNALNKSKERVGTDTNNEVETLADDIRDDIKLKESNVSDYNTGYQKFLDWCLENNISLSRQEMNAAKVKFV